ncbi:DEAD/DEAH box helicase [Ancylostoma ceylanicum]|uniref:DEAD/DEAH box helicase n=1 Tax=Ancylostoma ceylanicum TaxID=53326 RepID=A0A0D6M7R6_9BILA|nr:DEAD/DEAH box helicase [Ancylostoma ceylanicum]
MSRSTTGCGRRKQRKTCSPRPAAAYFHFRYRSLQTLLFSGGLDLKTQEAALRSSPDVVVATPGRLIDHLHNSPSFSLNSIEVNFDGLAKIQHQIVIIDLRKAVLVLDEADRMLEEAFKDQMNELIRLCAPNRQTLLFSATMTDQVRLSPLVWRIDELASMSLKKPVKIFINENTETALKLRQEFIRIRAGREADREAIIAALVTRTFQENTIVFVKMKKDCQRMHILLGLLGLKANRCAGFDRSGFKRSRYRGSSNSSFLYAVAHSGSSGAKSVFFQVINMHMPKTIKQYIHRVGRTARAGRVGRSISLVGEEERKLLKEIINTNPDRSLKQRQVAPEVVEAYRQRIDSLEDSIRQIDLEEKEERELRLAESAMKKTEEKLETGTTEREGRVWFKKATEGGT